MRFLGILGVTKLIALFVVVLGASSAQAAFILKFDSSPTSWVGQGQSFSVTPKDGYTFTHQNYKGYLLSFLVYSSANHPSPDHHHWTLRLGSPTGTPFTAGLYANAARHASVSTLTPGMDFYGDHRGNNQTGGFFNIIDIGFNNSGVLTTLAADFTQYGERQVDRWVKGSLRYNSSVPLAGSTDVAEPYSLAFILLGCLGLYVVQRQRRVVNKSLFSA